MTRLVHAELRRLASRRFTWLGLVALLIFTGIAVYGTAHDAKPLSGSELAMTQRSFEQARKDWVKHGAQMVKECRKDQAQQRKDDPTVDFGCDDMEPRWDQWGKPAPKLGALLPQTLHLGSYLLAFVCFLVGAGFVAAEFSTGAMGNWLTFEPRRTRVYASKLLAAGLGALVPAVAVVAILTGGVWLICHAWGSTTPPHGWGTELLTMLRVIALAVVAAVSGAAVGSMLRHTAAVIGVAMAYVVVVEGILVNSFLASGQPWLLLKNVDAWIAKGTTYFLQTCHIEQDGNYVCTGIDRHLSFAHGTVYLAVVVTAAALLGAVLFRRRDVP